MTTPRSRTEPHDSETEDPADGAPVPSEDELIAGHLRRVYDEVLAIPVPDDMLRLLDELADLPDEAADPAQDRAPRPNGAS